MAHVSGAGTYERRQHDFYPTPLKALEPLLPHLPPGQVFCEPCAGDGRLIRYLGESGHICVGAWDIEPRAPEIEKKDAREAQMGGVHCFITNPPWARPILHAIIDNLSKQAPTWLLFDSDWMHTKQANGYWQRCAKIVSIGRVRWIEGSKGQGTENCVWYRFDPGHTSGPHFTGRL